MTLLLLSLLACGDSTPKPYESAIGSFTPPEKDMMCKEDSFFGPLRVPLGFGVEQGEAGHYVACRGENRSVVMTSFSFAPTAEIVPWMDFQAEMDMPAGGPDPKWGEGTLSGHPAVTEVRFLMRGGEQGTRTSRFVRRGAGIYIASVLGPEGPTTDAVLDSVTFSDLQRRE